MKQRSYVYFPGCNADQVSRHISDCFRLVCEQLSIQLLDIDTFSCCGGAALQETNHHLGLLVNARNLAYAERLGLDIITPDATCYNMLERTRHELLQNEEERNRINEKLAPYSLVFTGKSEAKTLLHALIFDFDLTFAVKQSLDAFKTGAFYGCHTLRPRNITLFDERDCYALEQVMKSCGAQVVAYENRFECCGLHVMNIDRTMTKNIIKSNQKKEGLPVLHLAQFLGLALGLSYEDCGLDRHMTDCKSIKQKLELRQVQNFK